MWFNNRFTEDNKIHFIPSEWICTDPDEVQFCRPISKTEFEYIQLKEGSLKDQVVGGCNALAALDNETTIKDWYQDEIDVNEYDADEIGEYLMPYGDILDGIDNERDRNQLIAECIFETLTIMGEYDG